MGKQLTSGLLSLPQGSLFELYATNYATSALLRIAAGFNTLIIKLFTIFNNFLIYNQIPTLQKSVSSLVCVIKAGSFFHFKLGRKNTIRFNGKHKLNPLTIFVKHTYSSSCIVLIQFAKKCFTHNIRLSIAQIRNNCNLITNFYERAEIQYVVTKPAHRHPKANHDKLYHHV